MLLALRNPPTAPQALNSDTMNISLAHPTEFSRFTTFFLSTTFPPNGFNWANWKNPLIDKIEKSSDPEEIEANIRKSHELCPWRSAGRPVSAQPRAPRAFRWGQEAIPDDGSCGRC